MVTKGLDETRGHYEGSLQAKIVFILMHLVLAVLILIAFPFMALYRGGQWVKELYKEEGPTW